MLDTAREGGLLKARGRQRTDSTHVLAAVRTLNRLELVGETMRAALNAIATAAPEWLNSVAPLDWQERYDRRVENNRLPEAAAKRDAYAVQVGADGFQLLDVLDLPGTPPELPRLPAVGVLRRVWARHYQRIPQDAAGKGGGSTPGVQLRDLQGQDTGDRVASPYDPDVRFRSRSGRSWIGYMVHLTETCDADAPRLVVHADTTDAATHEAMRVAPTHAALDAKGLAPAQHLADAAYMGADLLLDAHERHGIDLIGPQHRDMSWQGASSDAFSIADFTMDWDKQVARCPEGKESAAWASYLNSQRPYKRALVQVRFRPSDCRACPSRARCTRTTPTRGRNLLLYPRREHEVLMAARARERTDDYRTLYAQRQGIESTIAQGARAFGLRQARYRGLAKTALQHVATAAALNLDRMAAWLAKRPLAPTRTSRFAALAA